MRYNKTILIIILAIGLFGCNTQKEIIVSPITKVPTNKFHPGSFVWHDLLTDDMPAAKSFYSQLFGWKFATENDPEGSYTTIIKDGELVGGIIKLKKRHGEVNYQPQWMPYLSVKDVDESFKLIKQRYCNVYRKPFNVTNRGRISVFSDPQGALLAIIKSSTGDPDLLEPEYNVFFWDELFTNDLKSSEDFYKQLAGYETENLKTRANTDYIIFKTKERRQAGMIKIPLENVKPNWLAYIAVKDASEVEKRAEQLGGKILVGSKDILGHDAAIISDPSGAVFAIHNWPLSKEIMDKLNENN